MSIPRRISYTEYQRRVFNKVLLECLSRIHNEVLSDGPDGDNGPDDQRLSEMAYRLSTTFFADELKLNESTIRQTRQRLSESVQFIQDCADTAEHIAEDKAEDAQKEKMEIMDDQEVELSDADKNVIDQLFSGKDPKLQVDQIRDATVAALLEEDKKAEEIKNAVDIAQSQVAAGADPKTLEETVNRLNKRGTTSLMHAIINNVSSMAIKEVNENGQFSSVGKVLHENKDEIKTRASMIYALYETCSVFGIHRYTDTEVRQLAINIYNEKV